MNNQTGFDVWERMLGDEGEQQEEDCYHGDEDASRDPWSVETDHMRNDEIRRILHLFPSTRLCSVAVFVGLDKSKEDMRTPSLAEWWTWQYQVPDDEDAQDDMAPTDQGRHDGCECYPCR